MSELDGYEEVLQEAISQWYSLDPLLSRGARMNFVIGERSAGKTYDAKRWFFQTWLRARDAGLTPPEWVYARRTEEEIAKVKKTLWNDYLPAEWELKTEGFKCFIRPKFEEEIVEDLDGKMRKSKPEPWEPFGYYMAISEAQDFKGNSFPLVDKMVLDEFIIENTRRFYMPNEVDLFLGLIDTVFRRRRIRVVCLSNSGAISNPYFAYYRVDSDSFKETKWVFRNDKSVLFEYYTSTKTQEEKEQYDIHKISNKSYRDYALGNKFKDASEELVADKPIYAKPYIKLTADGDRWFTVYKSKHGGYWMREIDSRAKGFALKPSLVSGDTVYSREVIAWIKETVDSRSISFNSVDTRAKFLAEISRN